jgi:YVTN family beta-propeller protein
MKNSSISGLKKSNQKRLVALLLSALMFGPFTAASAEVSGDLSSTTRGMTAGGAGTIKVGTQIRNVQAGDMLTAAEFLALTQVLDSGKQSVILGTLGNAIGGRVDLSHLGPDLSSLVIPRGVTALQNASAALNLTGNLTNSGNLYLYSTNPALHTGSIDAANILNNRTGLLSSVLPSTFANLGAITSLNLDLNALDSIINAGIIRSSGALTLTAGNSIVNSGIASVMSATNNINLLANNITNQGVISSALNNINISALNNNSILLNNLGGKLEALLGSINVRDSLFTAKSNFTMTGGDVLSQALNINSGDGIVNVNVKNVLGLVNVNAGVVHIEAATPNLQLGTMNITGDPTFYNTTGDVTINSDMIFPGQPLAIVAKGDILSNVANLDIDTSDTAGGGAITLIAGANFTSSDMLPSGSPAPNTTTLTITGGSTTGGEINLVGTGTPHLTKFDSSSSTGAAGDIIIIAYKGSVAGTGEIFTPSTVTINAQGATVNGDVQVIAGGTDKLNNAITVGGINNAGAGTGGAITLTTAKPTIVGGPVTILDGAITAGSFAPGALQVGAIRTLGTITAGDTFSATTLGPIQADGAITADGNITLTAGNTISVQQLTTTPGSNGNITLMTTANNGGINLGRDVLADGNVILQAHGTGSILGLNRVISTISSWAPEPAPVASNPGITPFPAFTAYLLGASVNPAGTRIYVPYYSNVGGRVYVLDAQTGAVITSISGFNKPQGTAVSPDGTRLYVTNAGTNTVTVVDTTTNTVLGAPISVGIGEFAEAVAVSPDGLKIFVLSHQGVSQGATKISVIDVGTSTVTNTINLTVNAAPAISNFQSGTIVINPQGTMAYASASEAKTVFAIDLATNTVVSTIDMGFLTTQRPFALAMDPTGTRVYVGEVLAPTSTTQGVGNIVVIDTNSTSTNFNKVIANVTLPTANTNGKGSFPQGLSVSPTGTELFVQSTYLDGVSVMYTAPNQVLEFVNVSPQRGPDGYGTTSSSSLITDANGVPHIVLYASNTQNVNPNGAVQTLSVIQKPTVQGDSVTLTSGGGNIILNYDAKGGTMTANTGGTGAVLLNNVGSLASTIGASSAAGNFFELGTVNDVTFNGGITSPNVILRSGGLTGDLTFAGSANIGKTGGIVDIRTNGGDMIQTGTGRFIGKTVNLYAATGDIGSLANPILTTTGSLAINAAVGNSAVSNTGTLNLNKSAAGGLFSLVNSGNLTVVKNGGILAPDISLETAAGSNGNIVLNAGLGLNQTAGNQITLETDGKGNITNAAGTFKIVADSLALFGNTGSFGSTSAAIRTQVNTLNISNFGTNAVVTNTGPVALTGFNSTNTNFVLKADDDITINGSVNFALNITIQTTANNGDINVNENIGYLPNLLDTVPNVTKIIAHGSGNINELRAIDSVGDNYATTDRGFVRGFILTLQSDSGNIGSGAMPLKTQSNNIKILTTGNADIYGEENLQSLGPYFMNLTGSTANTLNVVAQGRINVTGDLKSNTVNLSTLSGPGVLPTDINIGKNVGLAGVGSTTLEATDQANAIPNAGSITYTGGSILSQALTMTTDTGSIGTTTKLVKTAVQDLTANVTGVGNTGNIFITNTGALDINGITAGGTVKVLNKGAIDVDAAISATDITLQTSSNGSISLFDDITGTTSVTLNANGTGVLGRDTVLVPVITAPTVSLISGRGNIGSNQPGGRLEIDGATTALTAKTTGSIFLDLPNSTIIGTSSAGTTTGIFDVISDPLANISLGGNISASTINLVSGADILRPVGSTAVLSGKNVNLTAGGTAIGQPGQAIQTKASNLTLQNPAGSAYITNTIALTLGQIDIGAGQTLDIVNKANITIAGDINATGSTVNLTTNNGSGNIYQPSNVFTLTADVLNMSTVTSMAAVGTGSFGKVDAAIFTDVNTFNPSTKGKVFVENNGAVTINSPFAGSQLVLTASGDVSVNQALTTKSLTINTTGGNDILLNANIGVTGGLVNLNADDRIERAGPTTITGKTANLVATNGMGTGLLPILTAVTDLSLSTIGTDIFLDNFSPTLNLKTPVVVPNIANVQLTTTGNLVVATNFSGNNIQLSAGGAGNISTTTAGVITASNLQLSTQTGNIGTATALVKVNTMFLSANVFGASGMGTVGITNAGSPSLDLNPSSSRGSFTLVDSSGLLTVSDITTGFAGNELSTKSGLKITENNTVGTSAMTFTGALDVTGGGIIINNTNVTPGSTITFDVGATVDTLVDKSTPMTNGNIVIAIGKVPTTGTNPGAPNFTNTQGGTITVIETPPGQAFAGTVTNAVQGPAATFNATVNAAGRNIIFNSPNADSIILNDGVVIKADPPGLGAMSTPPAVPAVQQSAAPSTPVLPVSNTASSALPTMPALSNFNAAYNTNVATFFPMPVEVPVTAAIADINSDYEMGADNIALFIGDRMIAAQTLKASGALKAVSYISNGAASSKSYNVPLHGGGTLYVPSKDTDVETPMGTVHIGAGAAVLVYVQPGKALSVYNLHDEHREDVSITANGHEISVAPGTHSTIANGAVSDFAKVNGLDVIAHRNVRSANPAGLSMFSSEFSITSAMTGLNLLQSMRASSDKAQRDVVDDILKNAAILMQMGGANGGAYQRVGTKASSVTASN